MTIRKLHYVSGLVLVLFVGSHLFNHLCSIGGAERHIAVMNRLRPFYRNIAVELVLLSAVLIQIISGIGLFKAARKTKLRGIDKLHIYSGLYLAFFLLIHVSAVMAGRFILHLDTNFYFGAAGLNSFPVNLFFIPYYSLAIFAFCGHIAAIHRKKMKRSMLGLSPSGQAFVICVAGLLLTVLTLYGLTNRFRGIAVPEAYRVLTGK